jgi:hexosaminidase
MLAAAITALLAVAAPAQARPPTIPALREWHGAAGAFQLARTTRVVGGGAEGVALARGLKRPAVAGSAPQPGDVVLALGSPDRRLGREGYRLEVGSTLRVEARGEAGLFYGAQTVLQLLRGGGGAVAAGTARDWPSYPERGLMLDCGRRYYSPAWIKARIRELAALKLNQLHLHFSDNEGFRIESGSHPESVTRPFLTKRQVRDLIAYARARHVRVIPELDMPGHMQAALRAHPELQVAGRPDELDFTKPAARGFARDLILEYLDLFGGRWWHAGADEFSGPGDFVGFVNWIDGLVRGKGRTLRVWHDGLKGPGLRRDVVVEWWAEHAGPSPAELLAGGHRILNAGWWPTYYVNSPLGAVRPSMRAAYETWRVDAFGGLAINTPLPATPPQVVRRHRDRILGAELHVWNDDPGFETVAQTARGIAPRLRVIAQKTWGTRAPARSYAAFERLARRLLP